MRYKTVARILLTLNFVLVAPAAAREVREATADAMDRGQDYLWYSVQELRFRFRLFRSSEVVLH